jgi:uncharacterized protein (TIGR02145 family)
MAACLAACARSEIDNYRTTVMPDKKVWMAANLNLNIPGSYCYDDQEQNCRLYGRLYTWELAMEGCTKLGNGWRLPSDEEWQQMAKPYGGIRDDSGNDGKSAYKALIVGGSAKFDIVFGGRRGPNAGPYERKEAHGFYWTSTEINSDTVWFYNLGTNGQMVTRHDGEKNRSISVRCVRD